MDHEKNFDRIQEFLLEKLDETGAEGYALGLSGGMDSSAAAKTVVEALGPEKLVCWSMPAGPTREENTRDAREFAEELGVELREVDISGVVDSFVEDAPLDPGKRARGNVMARARMVFLYMEANANDRLVLGADNRSEIQLGYFTKYGDGAADVSIFAELYKTELREFARHVGLDEKFLEKEPTAELWEGQTDESELGEPYTVIDDILECLVDRQLDVVETSRRTGHPVEKVRKFRDMVKSSEHKRRRPDSPGLR